MQSYVRDAICYGGNLDWKYKGEFDDLMEHEKQKMTFENLESLELEPMKFNAFKVCSELTSRMDGVPMLNGFMKSQTSLPKSELILNKEVYFKTFITATPTKKHLISGNNYFSVLQNFITDISKSEKSKFPADLVTFAKEILDGKLHF